VQTREGNSPDWVQIGEAYCTKPVSIRALARHHGVSDTAVRKAAKKHGWVKAAANLTPCEPICEPEPKPVRTHIEVATKALASVSVAELTARGRNIILALMEELEFLNRHADDLSELVEEHFNGEKDERVRYKLQKALDHETRTKSSTQLASALRKLQDAAPGKKEEQETEVNGCRRTLPNAFPESRTGFAGRKISKDWPKLCGSRACPNDRYWQIVLKNSAVEAEGDR
jgi:hypothetical protein